jgi:hypothetical protein
MNHKKKYRRYRVSVSILGLDLAIYLSLTALVRVQRISESRLVQQGTVKLSRVHRCQKGVQLYISSEGYV